MPRRPTAIPHGDTAAGTLGAFGGVFAPSILTILGIIFYLRAGYVVGEVGLADALIIITICYAISFLTSISLSAIATTMPVKGGGFYYVISRTIGFEFGGALGVVLFLSISMGIAFYAIGLAEVVVGLQVMPGWISARMIAVGTILFLFAFAWAGADVATRLQYVVMAIVFASILAIGWGGLGQVRSPRRCGRTAAPCSPARAARSVSGPPSRCSSPRSPASRRGSTCRGISGAPHGTSRSAPCRPWPCPTSSMPGSRFSWPATRPDSSCGTTTSSYRRSRPSAGSSQRG